MNRLLFFLVFTLLFNCINHSQLTHITILPSKLNENSGIAFYSESNVWFIEDNGNSDNLYKINFKGNFTQQFDVKNVKNHDWEDLTNDKKGNLYIGDFGNNANNRKNLVIYKLPNPEIEKGDKINAEKIKFYYSHQKQFPPKKRNLFYDAEAFFHHNEHLYIFTKNRSDPFTGETHIYKISDKKGDYEAEFIGKLQLGLDRNTCQVTSADISPDGTKVVLLGYGKLWVLTGFKDDKFSNSDISEIDLGIRTQLESICFMNDKILLLSDEERDGTGGNLYRFTLN